jgi:hypothetical protein
MGGVKGIDGIGWVGAPVSGGAGLPAGSSRSSAAAAAAAKRAGCWVGGWVGACVLCSPVRIYFLIISSLSDSDEVIIMLGLSLRISFPMYYSNQYFFHLPA